MKEKCTILAVDSNSVNLVILEAMLSQNYTYITASDGAEAVNKALQHIPDLILMEVNLPGKDGYTICKELKQNKNTENIPVIFVSELNDSTSIEQGLKAGANDYVCKPFSRDELLARISKQIEIAQKNNNLINELKISKEAQQKLESENKTLKVMSDYLINAMILTDPDGNVIYASKSSKNIFDLDFELIGRNLTEIAENQKDKDTVREAINNIKKEGDYNQRFILHKSRYGKILVLETFGKVLKDDDGNIKMLVINTRNITRVAKSEARVRKNLEFQKNLRLISQNANTVHSFMANCTYLVNSLMELIKADEIILLIGRKDKWTEFFYHNGSEEGCRRGTMPPSDQKYPNFIKTLKENKNSIICNIQDPMIPEVIASRSPRYMVYPIIIENMLIGTIYVSRTNYGGITQESVYAIATIANLVRNNVRKKFYEKRIIQQEKEISSLFKYSANGIISINQNLEVERYNKRFLELFNITKNDDLTGVKLDTIIKGEPLKGIIKLVEKVGKPPLFETATISKTKSDGTKMFVEATASKMTIGDDVISLLIFTDITTLKNMDSAILSASNAAEEKERTRLAQELHDGLGALLSSINIYINLIISGGTEYEESFRTLKLTKELVGQAISSVKEIANNLHPVILSRFGLVATIKNIIEGLENSRLIKFGFSHSLYKPTNDKALELSVYRIINELINNTMKHAKAKNVAISLATENNHLLLEYADDGVGFDMKKLPKSKDGTGRGLSNIIGRVKAVNGKCSFKTKPHKGLNVLIEIPYMSGGQLNKGDK